MTDKTLKYWGWGYAKDGLSADDTKALFNTFSDGFGIEPSRDGAFPAMDAITLPTPKVEAPANLAKISTTDKHDRVVHSFGQSQPDSLRIYNGDFDHVVDVVAYPETSEDIAAIYDWAGDANAAVIPFGGGSSVVGGVTSDVGGAFNGVISVDMTRMDKLLSIDEKNTTAEIEAGANGRLLEEQLNAKGYTMGHEPDSYEFSTLGGWVSTAASGMSTERTISAILS